MKINVDFIYPIGSVYISTESTDPSILFGGKWIQTAKSRAIVGTGSNIANTDNSWGTFTANTYNFIAGSRVGEAAHTLSINEMPSHQHSAAGNFVINGYGGDAQANVSTGTAFRVTSKTAATGGSQAHNNIMPIEVYYIWKRVA